MSGMDSNSVRRSDRQRIGLHGNVKTCADEFSITEFAEDGKILFRQGNAFGGSKSERQYSYDTSGRVLSIQGGTGDPADNFQYEHGRKIRIRTIPARPERKGFFSVNGIFESTEGGAVLTEGGTVTTVFNDWDEPAESEVRDSEGHLLSRITHEYNPSGHLIKEALVRKVSEFTLPKRFRDQIPPERRETAIAEMRSVLQKSPHLISDNVERSYLYNEQGAVAKCHMQMSGYVQDISYEYNEHGDISEMTVRSEMEFQMIGGPSGEQHIEIRHLYAYDNHGNWTEQTTSSRPGRDESFKNSSTRRRQLVYY